MEKVNYDAPLRSRGTIYFEGMLVAIKRKEQGRREVYAIASKHPDGILLKNDAGLTLALSTKEFEESEPFPVGSIGIFGFWFYGQNKDTI